MDPDAALDRAHRVRLLELSADPPRWETLPSTPQPFLSPPAAALSPAPAGRYGTSVPGQHPDEPTHDEPVGGRQPAMSRRRMLQIAAGGAAASAAGAIASSSVRIETAEAAAQITTGYGDVVDCHGAHQAGVTTHQQRFVQMAAFDLVTFDRAQVAGMLQRWQSAIDALTLGHTLPGYDLGSEPFPTTAELRQPPVDTGEAVGQGPDSLTVTVGFGPSVFDRRYGLGPERPPALADLPGFATDHLDPSVSGGDVIVQACAETVLAAEHAIRSLTRLATREAVVRWFQAGFYEQPTEKGSPTARNLMGYKDGTANLDARDAGLMSENVWAQPGDGPSWMTGGTYQVIRRIQINLDKWDSDDLQKQQDTFGRYKASGAPFGERGEFDPVHPSQLPAHCHVNLANPRTGKTTQRERILRRSFNYQDGFDPAKSTFSQGLVFICFQRDPRRQFVKIQERLAAHDLLNRYTTHIGSGIFAVAPGVPAGGYVGQGLFPG